MYKNERWHCGKVSTQKSISGKILVLELWPKIILANQIADFFKLQYLKKALSYENDFVRVLRHPWKLHVGNIILCIYMHVYVYVSFHQCIVSIYLSYVSMHVWCVSGVCVSKLWCRSMYAIHDMHLFVYAWCVSVLYTWYLSMHTWYM